MISILISIFCGMLPEVLFLTFFLICTKKLKRHKFLLFICILIAYILLILVQNYRTIYYICFITSLYAILKVIYRNKTQIIDVFIISIAFMYICLISFICSRFINENYLNYYLLSIIDRLMLLIPFIFKNKFNILYKKYCKLWNRNDKGKRPIKSITLRNISLITLNSFIFLLNIATIYVINTFQ